MLEWETAGLTACAGAADGFSWYGTKGIQLLIDLSSLNGPDSTEDVEDRDYTPMLLAGMGEGAASLGFYLMAPVVGRRNALHRLDFWVPFTNRAATVENRIRHDPAVASYGNTEVLLYKSSVFFQRSEETGEKGIKMVIQYVGPATCGVVRIYLVAELFALFQRVPSGVYHQFNWINFIPHLWSNQVVYT
jgi:hypothetical protein